MQTQAGWYDDYGRQLTAATVNPARACFYLGDTIGLLTDLAVSPASASASTILRPQWDVRAVLTIPFPSAVRLYGEGWQFEVMSNPSQNASLSFKVDGQQYTINLSSLPAPQPVAVSWTVLDTMAFRASHVQRLQISVNTSYPSGGIELPRALRDADYYDIDDRLSTYSWFIEQNKLRAYNKSTQQEIGTGTNVTDSFTLFIAGHLA